MVTKNMMFDSPVYQAVLPIPLLTTGTSGTLTVGGLTGNAAQSNKFAAFTALLIKSLTLSATTVGTSSVASNGPLLFRVTNNGTTLVNTVTATYTLVPTGVAGGNGTAVTTAAYAVNAVPGTGVSTSAATANTLLTTDTKGGTAVYSIPVLQGDIVYIAKGTDATEVVQAVLESVIQPLASVSA
jgi:hypothetical protein